MRVAGPITTRIVLHPSVPNPFNPSTTIPLDVPMGGAAVRLEILDVAGRLVRSLGGDPFNMTVAGLRLARRANGVSTLHGETARAMWRHVAGAAPIIGIVNGVHAPTWQAPSIREAGRDPQRLWDAHVALKRELGGAIEALTPTRDTPGTRAVTGSPRCTGPP